MKYKEYIKQLLAFANKYPDALEFEVIHSTDDGNSFQSVEISPSVGFYDVEKYEFTSIDSDSFKGDIEDANVICVYR